MKLLIASDIHGSAHFCRLLVERIAAEAPDAILFLGDILYHGPRNDLPTGYAPKEVIELLNPLADRIVSIRGNCDSEVDQMVLKFPFLESYTIGIDGLTLTAVHGHHLEESPKHGDVTVFGHTHVPGVFEKPEIAPGRSFLNPGSVSIPRDGSYHSYMTCEGRRFEWRNVETGATYAHFEVK